MGKLNVNNGKLVVGKTNSSAKPQVYDKVNISVTNFSAASQFSFKLTARLPGGGDANISGKAGPISAQDAAKTPFETAVKVKNLDIAASGFIDAASGIAGLANFDGTLNSNGSQANAIGTFTGTKLRFSLRDRPLQICMAMILRLAFANRNHYSGWLAIRRTISLSPLRSQRLLSDNASVNDNRPWLHGCAGLAGLVGSTFELLILTVAGSIALLQSLTKKAEHAILSAEVLTRNPHSASSVCG